jgi:hypothetical protein
VCHCEPQHGGASIRKEVSGHDEGRYLPVEISLAEEDREDADRGAAGQGRRWHDWPRPFVVTPMTGRSRRPGRRSRPRGPVRPRSPVAQRRGRADRGHYAASAGRVSGCLIACLIAACHGWSAWQERTHVCIPSSGRGLEAFERVGELLAAGYAEFLVDVLEMMFHGPHGEHELAGDLMAGEPAGGQRRHFTLAWGE